MNHTATAAGPSARRPGSARTGRGRWTTLNIVLMVLGFVLFWPLGLAMLAYIIWGDEIGAKATEMRDRFHGYAERSRPDARGSADARDGLRSAPTGNAAFDAYRAEELRRIEEEWRKLAAMRAEFEGFLAELRVAKDQEEFDSFMREFRARTTSGGADAT